ncbi:MAG: DUF1294 domain-containing protein [Campylobacterota bacterium]
MISFNFTLTYFQIYLICINLIGFIFYTYDKLQSLKNIKNIKRVPENRLLFTTLLGGTVGSMIAMFTFRHKIKKPSFIVKFSIVVIIQVSLIYLYINQGLNLL